MHCFFKFSLLSCSLVVFGCAKGADLPELYPVKGRVLKNGKPVQGGQVQFAPQDTQAALLVNGAVNEDGTFTLTTHKGRSSAAGAPTGKYQVTYSPPPAAVSTTDPAKAKNAPPVILTKTQKIEAKENALTLNLGKARK